LSGGWSTPWGLEAHRTPPGSCALRVSKKAPSRNGNQPHVLVMILLYVIIGSSSQPWTIQKFI